MLVPTEVLACVFGVETRSCANVAFHIGLGKDVDVLAGFDEDLTVDRVAGMLIVLWYKL